jgi:hypothetical protein
MFYEYVYVVVNYCLMMIMTAVVAVVVVQEVRLRPLPGHGWQADAATFH